MRTPVSKLLPKNIITNSDKQTSCCKTNKYRFNKEQVMVCASKGCKNYGKAVTLIPVENATSYIIRPLNPTVKGYLTELAVAVRDRGEKAVRSDLLIKMWIQAGLIGWKNFSAEFKAERKKITAELEEMDVITDDCFNEIPYQDILEIASAIQMYDYLDGDQEKN